MTFGVFMMLGSIVSGEITINHTECRRKTSYNNRSKQRAIIWNYVIGRSINLGGRVERI